MKVTKMMLIFVGVFGVFLFASGQGYSSPITYTGIDQASLPSDPRPNSNAAAANFNAAAALLGPVRIITFEGLTVPSSSSFTAASGVNVAYSGDYSNSVPTGTGTYYSGVNNVMVNNGWGFNTTAGGSQYLGLAPHPVNTSNITASITFSFAQPINAFGGYFSGLEISPEIITLNYVTANGTYSLQLQNTTIDDPAVRFFGIIDTDPISQITLTAFVPAGTVNYDWWGIDDVIFAFPFQALPAETYNFVTKWGSYGTGDGQFNTPGGLALDSGGNVYVVDVRNNRIQKFDSNGNFITKWGSFGSGDGQFSWPQEVAIDSNDYVYVADGAQGNNNRVQKFDSNGNFITKWGSGGSGNGQFNWVRGIGVDSSNNVYAADQLNNRIQKFDSNGNFITKWGSGGSGDGQFLNPYSVAVDSQGYIFVTDWSNQRIQKFDSHGNFVTKWGSGGSGDGQFNNPSRVEIDSQDNVYVTDTDNHRVQKFDSNGNFITKWGSYGSGDGQFNEIYGLAVDSPQTVYVADHWNHRIQKFALLPPTETVSTPSTPGGPSSGITGTSYNYSTGGSASNLGHSVQYFFEWGDGTNSGWLPVGTTSASKIWASPGTYSVKVQARCSTDTSVVSGWSSGLSVIISTPTETVSTPSVLSGPISGITGTSYNYSTGGSSSSLGHAIQYFFDWGDGTNSGWLAVGTISASKSWASAGTYSVKAQARCSTDTSVASGWSSGLTVTISGPAEQPNVTPYQPTGWSDKVVVSNTMRTNVDSIQPYNTDPLYVDWAVINNGTSPASGYSVELYIDGVLKNTWSSCPALKPNSYYSQKDYPIGSLSVGTHTIKILVGNNGYTKTITISDISTAINLTMPSDNTSFGACSLYSPPTFGWEAGDTFKSYEIQLSPVQDFSSTSARVRTPSPSAVINSNTWKKVLSISEGTVYWRIVGTRTNRAIATSNSHSFTVESDQAVGNPRIEDAKKNSSPSLSWDNNCDIKFKVWFGGDPNFTKHYTVNFTIKDPTESGGKFSKKLTSSQWVAVRKLVGDKSGSTIYWYVESWDGLNRHPKPNVMSFILTD